MNSRHAVAYSFTGIVACLTLACGEKSIATVSKESEAIEILDVLRENKFDADKREVGGAEAKQWSVVIDEGWLGDGEAQMAMQVLRDYGLPRSVDKGVGEDNGGEGWIISDSAQKARRLKELETEIERQLRLLPGVTQVSANVVLPEDNTLSIKPYPATASVLIIHRDRPPPFTVGQLQAIIAHGVPNLSIENVTVSLTPQPSRSIATNRLDIMRRNKMISASGAGSAIILAFVMVILFLQFRRKGTKNLEEGKSEIGAG